MEQSGEACIHRAGGVIWQSVGRGVRKVGRAAETNMTTALTCGMGLDAIEYVRQCS